MRHAVAGVALIACAVLLAVVAPASANTAPQVSNVTAQQRSGTMLVDIYYDVYDADGDLMTVAAYCSDGTGGSVTISSTQQGSDIGPGIASGQGRHIVWDAGIDMPEHAGDGFAVRVEACDPGGESGMVLVPAGAFVMGDGVAYCGVDQRAVTLTRDFYLGDHEVTNQEYIDAVQWAYDHGYATATAASVRDDLDGGTAILLDLSSSCSEVQFDSGTGAFYLRQSPSSHAQDAYPGGYDPADHPVKEVTWYGAVRYCDWLSLRGGLPRAYQHAGDWSCNGGSPYTASGYRLPTDAEWEYAAQYDDGRVYPWGNQTPDCSRANYHGQAPAGCVGWTSPVGSYPDAPASLGLSDMAGNVFEWCNDRWACSLGTAADSDPVGPAVGSFRVFRGGTWSLSDYPLRRANRNCDIPEIKAYDLGFRIVRTAIP